MGFRSIKSKIILTSAICVIIVGALTSFYLYHNMSMIITEKSDMLDQTHMNTIKSQLNTKLDSFGNLANLCSNNLQVAEALEHKKVETLTEKRELLAAQNILRAYYAGSSASPYVEKLMVFNDSDVILQLFIRNTNTMQDAESVQSLPLYQLVSANPSAFRNGLLAVSQSIYNGAECLAYLQPVYNFAQAKYTGWFYMELNTQWVSASLAPYDKGSYVVLHNRTTPFPKDSAAHIPNGFPLGQMAKEEQYTHQGEVYRIHSTRLSLAELELYAISNVTFIEKDERSILYSTIFVLGTAILLAILLLIVLSNIITKPLNKLTDRIYKITANDFSFDAAIEEGDTEIADAGRMINVMSGGIRSLLQESERSYLEKKDADIALLQSQVSPHFLYNTLDSIYWMATIQKHTGIMTMTRGLSNLLKNLAKGVGDRVTLEEEIRLLQDYAAIQAIRYMESFQVIYEIDQIYLEHLIFKFTLQPILENAIFHGIVPKQTYGTIVIRAVEEGDDLIITIEDDGVGLTLQEIDNLFHHSTDPPSETKLSGLGVCNVHQRLQLYYGKEYGLSYESKEGEYTRAIVRIPQERK